MNKKILRKKIKYKVKTLTSRKRTENYTERCETVMEDDGRRLTALDTDGGNQSQIGILFFYCYSLSLRF